MTTRKDTSHLKTLQDDGVLDPVYEAKMKILNQSLQDIGFGRYQFFLFIVAGFGWFADSVWPLLTGLILAPVVAEFRIKGAYLSLATNIGLLVGTLLWGIGCDIWGRRRAFNITLFLAGAFGLAAGGSQTFVALCVLIAFVGFGVGGNIPVDATAFLDFMPPSHQYLLTVVAIFWTFGQLFVNLVAWGFIANYSCPLDGQSPCNASDNRGWRYLLYSLGAMTLFLWLIRFFCFHLYETPRYLLARGREAEAVSAVRGIAEYNKKPCSLSEDDLKKCGPPTNERQSGFMIKHSTFALERIKALFATRKMGLATSLLILVWGTIGLASTLYNNFLPYLLAKKGADFGDASLYIAYRNQVILSVVTIPAPLLAGWAVEIPYLGRRGTLTICCFMTGIFLFGSTTSRSSNDLLGWNCGYAFSSTAMFGVLYAFSAEVFPAKDRGTGSGLVATSSRVFGVLAPIIALYVNITTAVPVYISGALIMLAGIMAMIIPYEPRGKASM